MSRAQFDKWLQEKATPEQKAAYDSWKPEIQASFRVSWYYLQPVFPEKK